MSMIDSRNASPFQQEQIPTSISTAYQPVVLGGESTIHQHADASSEGSGYFTWICDAISYIFSTILEWLGCEEEIDTTATDLVFKENDEGKVGQLKKSPNVKDLYIKECIKLSDKEVAGIINKCPNLEEVALYGNRPSEKTCAAIAKLSSLRVLCAPAEMSDASFAAISKLPLINLDLMWCLKLTEEGLANLSNLTQLRNFTACNRIMKDEHLDVIARNPIETLSLIFCENISEAKWIDFLTSTKQLISLDVRRTNVTCSVLLVISQLPLLRQLSVRGLTTQSNEDGFLALSKMAELEELDVSDNDNVTDRVLMAYALMPELKKLDISDCKNITQKAREDFIAQKPHVTLIME